MAFLRRCAALLLPLALSGCAGLYFRPSRERLSRLERIAERFEEVSFESSDGTRLSGMFFPSRGGPARATVVHFHGNAENMSTHFVFAYWLVESGYNLLAFDYRGYGSSGGSPTIPGAIEDGRAALRYARSRPETPRGRLVVFGQSLGAALAAASVSLEPEGVRALVLDSPFSSYRAIARDKLARLIVTWPLQWPLSLLFPDDHSPLVYAPRLPRVPAVVIHGTKDRVVPFRQSRALYAALPGPKEDWPLEGAGHTEAFSKLAKELCPRLLRFLEAALSR